MSMNKNNLIMKMFSKSLVELPSPTSISYWWNFGSLCGLCLVIQILSGLFLSMHYSCSASLAFESVSHIMRDMNSGWVIRLAHVNGSSFFFIMLYLHIGRSLYYGGYFKKSVWCVGVTILLMVMAISFLGYVLPWGQMSFWGATVITNLFSAIPYIGSSIVFWLWGGFAVDNDTLTRFFSLHFMLPFVLTAVAVIHLLYLHESGSSNPLGVNSNMDKVPFHPYFSKKDVLGIFVVILFLLSLSFLNPWLFMDVENFIPANPLVTPIHIQPEWYFLFAYSILRSIPSKLGGVIALISSIVILYTLPFYNFKSYNSLSFRPLGKKLFWFLIVIFILLTWNGSCPVEDPYVVIGQWLSFLYFSYFLALPLVSSLENKLLIS